MAGTRDALLWVVLLPSRLAVLVLVLLIAAYRAGISPWLPPACRFTPSCSAYMAESLLVYGLVRGLLKGIWRILRCNPLCEGGHDPP